MSDIDTMRIYGVRFASKYLELYGKSVRSVIWIYSIKEKFSKIFSYYISGSNGIILMYDITNVNFLEWLSEKWVEIKESIEYSVPILLVGNKIDLEENREVLKNQVENFKEKHDLSYSMEISAQSEKSIEKILMNILIILF